jgi:hypothetical protein
VHLLGVRVVGLGPFDDMTIHLSDATGAPRRCVAVLGSGGVGRTSLLSAIASTRPGFAVPQLRPKTAVDRPSFVVTEWALGDDDPARPHALRVASPNAQLEGPDDEQMLRKREQALFDKRAQEGGHVLVAFSGARWFSRAPILLSSPERTVGRYDVRTTSAFDDATRADLARETKQALAYASIGAALSKDGADLVGFDRALRAVVGALAPATRFTYLGADPRTLEPLFASEHDVGEFPGRADSSHPLTFDELPSSARHLIAFGALTTRALFAAYPGRDPRAGEAVVLIDDIELHQDAIAQRLLLPALRDALPRVQWIVTTASPTVTSGCDASEVLALRRTPEAQGVQLYEGHLAVVH